MLKRPLNARFGPRVLAGLKRTTIRDTAWPLNKPIMLYHWSGKPYASPQQDVAAIQVRFTCPITICHILKQDGSSALHTLFSVSALHALRQALHVPVESINLWQLEGFDSRDAMDTWFLAKLKPGQTVHKHLMLFDLLPPET